MRIFAQMVAPTAGRCPEHTHAHTSRISIIYSILYTLENGFMSRGLSLICVIIRWRGCEQTYIDQCDSMRADREMMTARTSLANRAHNTGGGGTKKNGI